LNLDWDTSGPSFFTHFEAMERGFNLEAEIPPDVIRVETEHIIARRMEPPVTQSNWLQINWHDPKIIIH
jgi:hypothetical protein